MYESRPEASKGPLITMRGLSRKRRCFYGGKLLRWDESVLIEEIVRDVSDKLFSESSNDDNKLVGMSYHMEQMNSSLLCNDGSEEVLMVGIYGMGGIGKTTISRALYNRYSHLYDGRCYVANIKDIFRKHDPSSLREKLLSEIFMDRNLKIHTLKDNFNVIREKLSRKKVFIVLDDVDGVEQLETLSDKHEWFGPGSRIIITTRDQRLLISHGVDYLYKVKNLRDNEAFQLFSQYAFKRDIPTPDYLVLSDQFVLYAKGLPLALKVLGSFLYMKNVDEWRSELDKLKKNPNAEIQDLLRISFDGLDDKQKDIFLDISCFFIREEKDLLIDIWKSCGFFSETGLRVLVEKMSLSGCKGKDSAGLLLPLLLGLDSLNVLELMDFNILEFPEDALRLSSLETLNLRGNSFERIDLSLGPLSNLSVLKLNECKKLQSISNLPSNIRQLQAHNCSSLEIVSSWMSKSKLDVWEICPNLETFFYAITICFHKLLQSETYDTEKCYD